ncbi:putative ATP-grasp-modified RiPP [Streptomyces daliensis]|uniref:Putative ATP-grasp-modified RiPP n=1 Tax=Streptomyces daliensis TaxID=299421 RepID=A0A8T4IQP1_9ACTN|nr:putative ATP-grasp-modified RiPP [Streptomyces daliensis]
MANGTTGPAGRPWGATRMGPYPTTVKMPFTAVDIDPATQMGVFRDASGRVVRMDEGRTHSSTHTSQSTNYGDGHSDDSTDSDSHND